MQSTVIRVDHLCCGAESKIIRETIGKVDGVLDLKISLVDRRVSVDHRDTIEANSLVDALNDKHLGASLHSKGDHSHMASTLSPLRLVRLGLPAVQVLCFATAVVLKNTGQRLASDIVSVLCVLLSWPMFYSASLSVVRLRPNVEFLMSTAMLGALVLREFTEAASVGAIVTIMDAVKVFMMVAIEKKLRNAVVVAPSSVDTPEKGMVLVADLKEGDEYLARVGDAIATDGIVLKGKGTVDESRVTGEAMPQHKEKDSAVHGGSLVSAGFLHVRATVPASASFESRVADAVHDAKNTLSDAEDVVSRFAVWYTPTVLVVAALVGVIYVDLNRFLVILVAGCPCALLGAAPFVFGSSLALLAGRHGLLIKQATALEALGKMELLCFDKTGTITQGMFTLLEFRCVSKWSKSELHEWVAAVEGRDNHPLARSLVGSYTGCNASFFGGKDGLLEVTGFKRQGREGVYGTVAGHVVGVGNEKFLKEMEISFDESVTEGLDEGGSIIYVAVDGELAAVLLLRDEVRPESSAVVDRLQSLGVQSAMLTGDKPEPAARAARASNIPSANVYSTLLPDQKAKIVMDMTHQGNPVQPGQEMTQMKEAPAAEGNDLEASLDIHTAWRDRGQRVVGFVGDGLNDCPALASAHVGVVLQEMGSQSLVDASDAMLQGGTISHIPAAVVVARRTRLLVLFNIFLALVTNLAVILVAATVGMPLWVSVLADSGGLIVVMLNSLWPLLWRVGPTQPHAPATTLEPTANEAAASPDTNPEGFTRLEE